MTEDNLHAENLTRAEQVMLLIWTRGVKIHLAGIWVTKEENQSRLRREVAAIISK